MGKLTLLFTRANSQSIHDYGVLSISLSMVKRIDGYLPPQHQGMYPSQVALAKGVPERCRDCVHEP
jgi:hypothetical protein